MFEEPCSCCARYLESSVSADFTCGVRLDRVYSKEGWNGRAGPSVLMVKG